MKFNELKTRPAQKNQRPGRGIAAGRGKTAGRGTKGQGARKSGGVRPGFEGGQMPVYMRLPHLRGFKSHRPKTETVYTKQIDSLKKSTIDNQTLFEAGLVSSSHTRVKLLMSGELKSQKEVKLQSASRSAIEALQKAGGSFAPIVQVGRSATSAKKLKNK